MAPKEPFKVHSLSKHIQDTQKGLSAEAQFNRSRPSQRPTAVKKEGASFDAAIFGNGDGDDDDESSSSDSSDEEGGGSAFLRNLAPTSSVSAGKRSKQDKEIADSDDERKASSLNKKAPAAKKAEKESSESSESESESDSESEEETEVKKPAVNGAKSTATSSTSDTSSEDDSDESSESESEDEAVAQPKPVAAAKPPPTVDGKTTAQSSATSSSGESESEAESGSDAASSSSGDEDSDAEMADESVHISDREQSQQLAIPGFITPDFVLRKGNDGVNGQDVAEICNQANTSGKQFWYFTVPSHVPISVIQNLEIPMDQAQRGESVFSHNGENYGVSFDSMTPKSSIQILIPSADGPQYRTASRPVDQVMQVRRLTTLGGSDSSVGPAPQPAPRPQPKGLRARYQPMGVTTPMGKIGMDESGGEADAEMVDAPASEPAKTTPAKAARKTKRKQPTSEDDAAAVAAQLKAETQSAATKSKKQKTIRNGSPDLGSEPASAAKKKTPVAAPTVPQPAFSFSNLPSETAASTSTPKSAKKAKKDKPVTPAVKQTPVPVPRQTAVPLPNLPSSSQPKSSQATASQPAAASSPSVEKKTKKRKEKESKKATPAPSSSQPAPPSSQPLSGKKVTPVPPPPIRGLV